MNRNSHGGGRTRFLALALSEVTACSLFGPSDGGQLSSAMARWDANGYASYEFTLRYTCGECIQRAYRIRVSGEQIVQVTDLISELTIAPNEFTRPIPDLFAYIQTILDRDPDEFDADYDAALGYPHSVAVDYDRQAIDDESGFTVTGLVQHPAEPALLGKRISARTDPPP